MNQAFVLLGSNIDRERNLATAVALLRTSSYGQVIKTSKVYETVPVGWQAQANFLNAAVLMETPLTAVAFKAKVLDGLETALQRVRTTRKDGPRTMDADLILFNDEVSLDGRCRLPSPHLLAWAYVAVPIAELAPTYCHPETGEPLHVIARRLYDPSLLWLCRAVVL